ncbi:MATE family efflux transporter [Pedobacter cryoconitis]|uniref:Multidrug-efflux transporter n=1 Tax=Pedobacter cryoconitis TaxID=188932 RepID=A0A7X0MMC4_9SPHI|nr:MATE family efflux transporter [Pedobacter cryoconitis]MBB6502820.1 MATE family multidrug resistance protein [Pedobacter cryoconitis]
METSKTIKLAIPLIIGELSQIVLHIIDMAMVGSLSYKHLAAASLVMNVINIPFIMGIGIAMSIAQTVSMANGSHDGKKISHYLFNGLILCLITSIIICIGLELGTGVLHHLGQDKEVVELAIPFMRIMSYSTIPMLLFIALQQFTDGLEKTRTAMLISLIALPINIFFNWLLILGNLDFPRMELLGAAWGTLMTRVIIFVLMGATILISPFYKRFIAVWKKQWVIKWETIRELLGLGIPSGLQIGMEFGAFAVSGILIGTIGAKELAAHQIALSCVAFTFIFFTGLAEAGSIRISNAYGGMDWKKGYIIGNGTVLTALIFGGFCALVLFMIRNIIPFAFTADQQVVAMAGPLILYAAVFQIPDALQTITAGLLRGIKDVNIPTGLIAIAYWVIGLPSGYYLAFHLNLGPIGIWTGFLIGLSISSALLLFRFKKKMGNQHITV